MSEIEIRSLNGHKLVDETARLEIEEIKMNGAGGGVGQPGTGAGNVYYGTCDTPASTQVKLIYLTGVEDLKIDNGTLFYIYFTNTNIYTSTSAPYIFRFVRSGDSDNIVIASLNIRSSIMDPHIAGVAGSYGVYIYRDGSLDFLCTSKYDFHEYTTCTVDGTTRTLSKDIIPKNGSLLTVKFTYSISGPTQISFKTGTSPYRIMSPGSNPITLRPGEILEGDTVTFLIDTNSRLLIMINVYRPLLYGLPSPTVEDAGKFLRVSAQGYYDLETIPNAEEAKF